MPNKSFLWAAFLVLTIKIASPANNVQTISMVEPACRAAPSAANLATYIDINTGTIYTAQGALQLIETLLKSQAAADCSPVGASYVSRNFHGLFKQPANAGDNPYDEKRLQAADFIVHVMRWTDPASSDPNSTPQLKVEQQRWYLIHDGKFLRPGRMLGTRTVYFVYIHLNKDPRAKYKSDYEFTVTQAIPQNQQNLQLLASLLAPAANGNASAGPAVVWGGQEVDMWYSTADIAVDSSVTDLSAANGNPTNLDQTYKVHNEALNWWDVSAGIPLRKMSQVNFQSSNNTLVPQTVDKKSVYAMVDFYPFRSQQRDLAYNNFTWYPSLLAGLSVSQQPLHQPLFALGWGPRFAQFYFGVIIRKQVSIPTTSTLAAGTKACTGWCPEFAFGINLPVKALQSALSSKSSTSAGNANSQEGAGAKPGPTPSQNP